MTWSETSCEAVFWTDSRGTEVAGNKRVLSVFLLLDVFVYRGEAEKSQCQQTAATLLLWEMTAGQPGHGHHREGDPADLDAGGA